MLQDSRWNQFVRVFDATLDSVFRKTGFAMVFRIVVEKKTRTRDIAKNFKKIVKIAWTTAVSIYDNLNISKNLKFLSLLTVQ